MKVDAVVHCETNGKSVADEVNIVTAHLTVLGGLVSLFGFVMIPVIFLAGFVTDLLGRQVVFMGGSILLALSLWLLAQPIVQEGVKG